MAGMNGKGKKGNKESQMKTNLAGNKVHEVEAGFRADTLGLTG